MGSGFRWPVLNGRFLCGGARPDCAKPVLLGLAMVLAVITARPAGAIVRVAATTSDLASIAKAVGGDLVEVMTLSEGIEDPHFLQPLPSHMLTVKRADLLLEVGLDFEPWSDDIVLGSRNRKLKVVDCSQGIEILEVPEEPVDWEPGDLHRQGNPHYWLDPANGAQMARTITAALIEVDPGRKVDFEKRRDDFLGRLEEKTKEWNKMMEPYRGAKIVYVHNGWPYFNRAFGLETIGILERKPGVGPGPGHANELMKALKNRQTQIIVMSAVQDAKIPYQIATKSWAELVMLAQSVGARKGAKDYFSLFDVNLKLLTNAIQRVR